MKTAGTVARILLIVSFLAGGGCEVGPPVPPGVSEGGSDLLSTCASYSAAKVDIIPLTEVVSPGTPDVTAEIKAYVSVLDSFGCQMKSPGVFRFELYDYGRRSPEPMGRRVGIWPDVDLTEVSTNNDYWRDYLRAYEFRLPFELQTNRTYLLQVTCLCPTGKRLTGDFELKTGK
ncbi:MAG: hypothetical protein ACYTEQ_20330 [Planctomycetota bacterium]|jgi:hypothetical protein